MPKQAIKKPKLKVDQKQKENVDNLINFCETLANHFGLIGKYAETKIGMEELQELSALGARMSVNDRKLLQHLILTYTRRDNV